MSDPELTRPRPQRGFSLVELVVSLLIGLLISLAALSMAQTFMATQRQSGAMASAEGDADVTLGALKMEVAQSGLGFFSLGAPLCATMNLSVAGKVLADNTPVLPYSLSLDAQGQLSVDILYASTLEASSPALTATDTSAAVGSVDLASNIPVVANAIPVAQQQAVLLIPPFGMSAPCTVATVTSSTPGTDEQPQRLLFAPAGLHNAHDFPDVNYPINSKVALLGQLNWNRFRLDGTNLVLDRVLPSPQQSSVVLRNVVAFRAQYGNAPNAGSLQSWQDPVGEWAVLSSANLASVTSTRLAVVVRSTQREKPGAQGPCTATTTQPLVFDQPLALEGDWQCYRYRVIGITVPLRNPFYGLS